MDATRGLTQTVSFKTLDADCSLATILDLKAPPFRTDSDAFRQLKYLEDYVRRPDLARASATRSFAVESHYIDRDFIVDHSVLFSRNLQPPVNYCRRVHFFAADVNAVETELEHIIRILLNGGKDAAKEYRDACREFSHRCYLGFTVIRPLQGCPVGRTVLRHLPPDKPEDDSVRVMKCTRNYEVHFMGVDLTVRGLAFQQQDLGVSRCATVAVWCALHKIRERESIAGLTPADITSLASKHRLPFGRSMPSEGLAVDQLCLAIESVGVSPYLAVVSSIERGRSLIYSATLSEMPCILIMQKESAPRDWHAVTVTGIKLNASHVPCFVGDSRAAGDDLSGDLKAIYVHDDRLGPYRRAELNCSNPNELRVTIKVESHVPTGKTEDWIVRHVLIPMHPKIRISFNDLRTVTVEWLTPEVQKVVAGEHNIPVEDLEAVQFCFWIERGHEYSQRVLTEKLLGEDRAIDLCKTYVLPRYVGVIRYSSERFGQFDVLMDTTSPRPNYNWIGVIARRTDDSFGKLRHVIAEYIADCCRCQKHFFS